MLKLATLVYVKDAGRTLMLHRTKKAGDMHQGKWNGLGGKFEPGESPEECAVREVLEESGLHITAPQLCGLLTFPGFQPDEDWYAFVFVARHFTGQLIDSNEGELAWIHDDQLMALPLWEGDRIFLPWLERRDRFFSAKFVYKEGRLVEHDVVFYPLDADREQQDSLLVTEADAGQAPPANPAGETFAAAYTPQDDTYCWVCGGSVDKHNCKIICRTCGFIRDCSDP